MGPRTVCTVAIVRGRYSGRARVAQERAQVGVRGPYPALERSLGKPEPTGRLHEGVAGEDVLHRRPSPSREGRDGTTYPGREVDEHDGVVRAGPVVGGL